MQEFYLTVEQLGNHIIERYIDKNGVEQKRKVAYQPSLFCHAAPGKETKYHDIYGKNCLRKDFDSIRDAKDWMKRMKDTGQEVLGMDDFKLAYISDTYGSEIVYNRKFIRIANCDIEVTAAEFPKPNEALYEIDAITHYDSIDDKFYVFDLLDSQYGKVTKWSPQLAVKSEADGGDELDPELVDKVVYLPFDNEKELLLEYVRLWEEKPPVIFTGWNVEGFDIPYIVTRITNVLGEKVAQRMSPCRKINSKVIQNVYGEQVIFSILGVTVLDYLDLYKKFSFTNQPTYNLDFVSEYETGKGKLKYDGPINKLRELNHNRYISYNIEDVNRVQAIDKIRQFIELSLSLGYYSKMQIQSVFSPLKTWDAIIFNSLKEQKKVIPETKSHIKQSYPGAYVKEPVPNAYRWVLSFDLTSLYPSIIRQVNISPETLVGTFPVSPMADYISKKAPRPSDEYSCSPNGWMYRKDIEGVIPAEVKKVFLQRKEHKGYKLSADRNMERVKGLLHKAGTTDYDFDITTLMVNKDFSDDILETLAKCSVKQLEEVEHMCEMMSISSQTAQINRKLLINSCYGALGNIWFRYYDLRNASAITLFGQLAIQWIERKINEYLNDVLKTENRSYVIAGDTDSVYVCIDELVGRYEHKFNNDTQKLIDFLSRFAAEKMEPAIDAAYQELREYMNNREHLMFMDREAISGPPLDSKGIGGFWTAKKRYALNVWDMEGTRYDEPKLKIMGLETQKSSTPKSCQVALKECIRRMLQEGEESLQEYYAEFEKEFRKQPYKTIASVSSANNLMKYADSAGFPEKGCPYHVKGVLAYNRCTKDYEGIPPIFEGEKVMVLPLKDPNPFGEKVISWPSGNDLPKEIEELVLNHLDYKELFNKTFVKPLSSFTTAAKLDYEQRATLDDLFDI
ncbi:hypothetical protein [Providencia phage PSTRCR_127]|nr:hypothetical protein [Providencia phage PSTRCR_127]